MENLFNSFGIKITEKQLDLFDKYYRLLIEYNGKFNITAILEKQEVYLKHFVDSLLFVDKLKSGNLIDIGSGGGFPALPIKILREDISVTMVEATVKKCEFLQAVVDNLNLSGVKIINARAEDLAKKEEYREKFDICSARAVARLNTLCEYCMPFVKVGGVFCAFKGNAEEEILEAKNAIKILGGKLNNVYNADLSGASRSLIEIEKVENTPNKYPRGNGKERKNPL
jgi:16S rRNA (guanine527-N7)-methyltransferase